MQRGGKRQETAAVHNQWGSFMSFLKTDSSLILSFCVILLLNKAHLSSPTCSKSQWWTSWTEPLSLAFWPTQMGSAFRPEFDLCPPYSQQGCLTLRQSCTTGLFSLVSLSIGFKQSAPSDRWTKLNRSSIQQAVFSIANSPSHVINGRLVCKRGVLHWSARPCVSHSGHRGFCQKAPARDDLTPKCVRLKGYMCVCGVSMCQSKKA